MAQHRHSGCICVGGCVWFKLNAPFNQFCWHALSPHPGFLPLILFNIVSATSASLSPHAMIPCPSSSSSSLSRFLFSFSSLLHPSVPNSIFAFAFALFIYLFIVMLVYCFAFDWLRRLLFDAGQGIWPAFCFFFLFLFDFAFTFTLRIRPVSFIAGIFDGNKKKTDFIRNVTQHLIMHYSCYYILQGICM